MRNELVDDFGALGPVLMTKGVSLGLGTYVKKLSDGREDTVDAIVSHRKKKRASER
jgi:hypothetical protein